MRGNIVFSPLRIRSTTKTSYMRQKIAYLTIDDAPVTDMKEKIDFLASEGIRAIWFCQGNKLVKFPDQAIYVIKKGHIIGNHSYDHSNFSAIMIFQQF
jgi:peptidoglycan/xylan/chitin deacetylase (PgdA/CDA1 family)